MNFYAIPPIVTCITIFAIGFLVYINNLKSKVNVIFSLFCLSMVLWLFGFSMMYLTRDNTTEALQWARLGFMGIIFIPILAYHFIISFIDYHPGKWLLSILYLTALPSIFLGWTDFVYNGVARYFWGFYPTAGKLYFIFLSMFAGLFSYGVLLLFFAWRNSKRGSVKAQQLFYVLIAFAGGTTGVVDYIIKYRVPIYPIGYLAALFFISVIAYAITKHHLLDIEVVIKKTAVYSLLTALLTGLFISVILIGNSLLGSFLGYNSIWFGTLAAFLVAFLFQPLRDKVQELVDKAFFRARYDYQRILRKYSHALSQPMTDLDRFAHLAPYLLTHSMNLSGASVMVLEREEKHYLVRAGVREGESLEGLTIPEDSPLIQEIYQKKKELIKEEIQDPAIRTEMEKLKAVLIIPSISWSTYFQKPTLLCTTNLGEKLSGEPFSREDIEFLRTMANQASISIEHAFILEELRKHQEQIIKSEKMAALGTATAGIAHELKNPLTYIMTVAQTLPQGWDNPSFRESVMKMLPSEAERMKLILDGILDFSRTRELTLQPVEITEVLKKTLALLAYEIKKGRVYVKEEYRHTAKVLGDPNRLTQVFVNIINNAVQAMGEKGGDLTILSQDHEKEVRISIIDTGPGMSKEVLRKIFDPFFTTKSSGTGLGLAITKKIMEEHHGNILVNSSPGRGTSFTVCLPQAELGYRI